MSDTPIGFSVHVPWFAWKWQQQAWILLTQPPPNFQRFVQLALFGGFELCEITAASADTAAPQRSTASPVYDRAAPIAGRTEKPLTLAAEVRRRPRRDDPFAVKVENFGYHVDQFGQLTNVNLGCAVTNHLDSVNIFQGLSRVLRGPLSGRFMRLLRICMKLISQRNSTTCGPRYYHAAPPSALLSCSAPPPHPPP